MSARDEILRAVREARTATFGASPPPALPGLPASEALAGSSHAALLARFTAAAEAAATRVEIGTRRLARDRVASWFPQARSLLSMVPEVEGTIALPDDPHALATLDVLVCEGVVGVAENGAIWLPVSRLGARAALVLAAEVVVLLRQRAIVPDLHAAYEAVDVAAESFGVFLAGPSKTADIEQSLVIGAHGARGTTVLLLDE